MKNYRRLMLGKGSMYAKTCFAENFVGTDFDVRQDLTNRLPEDWRAFNKEFVPIYLELHPTKTKIGAGLACGQLWTVSKGMKIGDIVLSPDGTGRYRVAEVTGPYIYQPTSVLTHTRPVRWLEKSIDRVDMTQPLRNACGSPGTVVWLDDYSGEIERLLGLTSEPTLSLSEEAVEDVAEFAMEKHLEDFLVQNWAQTDFGKEFDIYREDGELVGQQYRTDTGPLDILALSKDGKRLLVIELKKGRASDVVVGQTLRYMGYVKAELAEEGQEVLGVIIALDDDQRIRRALTLVPSISFYRYEIRFKLTRS